MPSQRVAVGLDDWERVFNPSEPRFLHLYNGALSTMLTVSL